MKKYTEHVFVFGFIATLFVFSLLFFIFPQPRFSELENRYLQASPEFSWESIISKKFTEETETFITDHFPFRAEWIAVKSTMERLRLQQENNGVYQGKDGYLFEKVVEPNLKNFDQSIDSINRFAVEHEDIAFTFMLVPTSVGLYAERLPWLAPTYDQKNIHRYMKTMIDERILFMDGFDMLEPYKSEPIYYRTDHHWTTYGAYIAYSSYAKKMGWEPLERADFQVETVSDSFLGSYHTRSQFSGVSPDKIQAFVLQPPNKTEIYIADSDETMMSMYDETFLQKKDQYSYFLGGVHALMEIRTEFDMENIDEEKILVIKDSFAHSFIPFLTNHVEEIHVIDLRYYNGNIDKYIENNNIKSVLLLFNTSTINDHPLSLK